VQSLGHLLKASVTCADIKQTQALLLLNLLFFCLWLWFMMSCTMFMVGIATQFLGKFTVKVWFC